MTKNLALAEWRRARKAQRAAEVLLRDECFEDAVSRAYYAVFHGAKAALFVHNIAADSHAAVRRMFGLHLIKSRRIEAEWAAHLAETLDDRLAADYDPEARFSQKDVRRQCRQMRAFMSRIRRYLLANGFRTSELRMKVK